MNDIIAPSRYALHYLIETYGRDWELSEEALALAATLPPEQERAA